MAQNKLDDSREADLRDHDTRDEEAHSPRWKRPDVLPSPKPRKGYEHRWIRVATHGQPDPTNISSKIREGWEPCKAKDYPEITVSFVEHERFKNNVVMGGQMLCRAPVEMVRQRKEHFANQTRAQMEAVDNNLMRESDPRMPIFKDRKSTTSFGPR